MSYRLVFSYIFVVLLLVSLLLSFHLLFVKPCFAAEPISVSLDGAPLHFDTPPVIISNRTMVPFRAVAEGLGVNVEWVASSRSVVAKGYGKEVVLRVNSREALVNGAGVTLDAAPVIISNRTLVPLRFFSEAFGADVKWDGATRHITITGPPYNFYRMAFYAIRSFNQRHLIPCFDAVAFGWSHLTADGSLELNGQDFFWPQPAGSVTPEGIIKDARRKGVTCYLMVFMTDEGGALRALLDDKEKVNRAVDHIAALASEKDFDGVLLDLEGLGWKEDGVQLEATRDAFTRFVNKLASRLHAQSKTIALALHPPNSEYRGYDYAALGQSSDLVIIMAYDYQDKPGSEPVNKVEEAVRMAAGQVPREKLVLGISAWSETPESMPEKIAVVKRFRLKGYAVWRLGLIKAGMIETLTSAT
ncbi:MAG: glycosyl hydrolase [Peptococcaceae bacterium]|nr:glycosyl hydrolase [Peptococcaceae bacterium]